MLEYYPEARLAHITCVVASGMLFFVRGLAVQAGATWPMVAPLRYASYAIDTVLLGAAVVLALLLHQYPLADAWLTVKVVLLLCYIVAGSFALKRGRTQTARLYCWLLAVFLYLVIVWVARTRFPA